MSVFYVQDTKYEHCGQFAKWIFSIQVLLEVCTLLKDAMSLTVIKDAIEARQERRLRVFLSTSRKVIYDLTLGKVLAISPVLNLQPKKLYHSNLLVKYYK